MKSLCVRLIFMIRENSLPPILFGKTKTLSPVIGALSTMPVKKIWNGTHKSSDVILGEVLKLHARERRTGSGRDRRGGGSIMSTAYGP